MKIDKEQAANIFKEEAALSKTTKLDSSWIEKVEQFSQLCEEGVSKTHIAFLATAMLAKSVNHMADLMAIKPNHARGNPNAFSARTLCHGVIVPLAAELGISIGVTGREPLNNQPYFRMTRLDDKTPVHAGARAAFDYMLELVQELQSIHDEELARKALRAFIAVRLRFQPRYTDLDGESTLFPHQLVNAISHFVLDNSEHGKRAQAVVAGLMDVFAGTERVESGRINDPSRKHPGDVCVLSETDPTKWEKAIEVRDKPVSASDVQIFAKKCIDMGVREVALVIVAEAQEPLDILALSEWASSFGIGLTVFQGWEAFVEQVLYWSNLPKPLATRKATNTIHQRLIEVEASEEGVNLWHDVSRRQ